MSGITGRAFDPFIRPLSELWDEAFLKGEESFSLSEKERSERAALCRRTKLLERINLIRIDFSRELPLSPLHWMIADQNEAIVVESVRDGLKVYDNPASAGQRAADPV